MPEENGTLGRLVQFTWNDDYVGAAREKGLTINNNPVDVTVDEDSGWRTLLEEPGEVQVDIALSGVDRDGSFRNAALNGPRQGTGKLTYPNGYEIEGTFNIASYTDGIPYNNAVTFSATLQSSGEVTGATPTPEPPEDP